MNKKTVYGKKITSIIKIAKEKTRSGSEHFRGFYFAPQAGIKFYEVFELLLVLSSESSHTGTAHTACALNNLSHITSTPDSSVCFSSLCGNSSPGLRAEEEFKSEFFKINMSDV